MNVDDKNVEEKVKNIVAEGKVDVFTISWTMVDPKGSIFRGRCHKAYIKVVCADELSIWESKPFFVVKTLALIEASEQEKKGETINTFWNDALKKGFTSYPSKSKEEVRNIELELINRFGGKL
jgi:hypothetical protein